MAVTEAREATAQGVHAALVERHRAVLPSWLSLYYDEPIELVQGSGRRVVDGEGREYLDFFGGILTTMVGHAVPEVVAAVQEQAGRILHSSTLYLIRPMIELAERIAELSGIEGAKVFFVSSGTEANEAALLLTAVARRSNQVLALRNSYHGRSFAATAVTGNRSWSASGFSPLSVSYLHNGDRRHGALAGMDDSAFLAACAADVEEVLATTTAGEVACLIAEPIQGVGGFVIPPAGFLSTVVGAVRAHGIPFISDEVQTGWGRTGSHFWGWQADGVVPDLMTFAKGLGNGLAIGGVAGRAELMDAVSVNSISTFGGNPLSTAGALATLNYLLDHHLQANAETVGARLLARLRPLEAELDIVAEVRGRGLMIAVELVDPATCRPSPVLAGAALEAARRNGLLIGKGGLYGNVLRIAPPLSLTGAEADEGADALIAALRRCGGKEN